MTREEARELAGRIIAEHEGGFSNDPVDPGGPTQYGISLRWLATIGEAGDLDRDGDVDEEDIRKMTVDQAAEFALVYFWDPHRYGELPDAVAAKVFDLTWNMGPKGSHRVLQRALRAAGYPLDDDGILGVKTRTALIAIAQDAQALLWAIRSEAAGYYRGLVLRNASLGRFLKGWLNRAYS